MELHINVSNIQEIVQGAHILNALIMAHKAQQDASLAQDKAEAGTGARQTETEQVAEQVSEHVADAAKQADTGEGNQTRKRGRPPGSGKAPSDKKNAAEAAGQPVGAALAGVPARDLASALDAGGEVAHKDDKVEVRTAPEIDPTERAQVKAGTNGKGSPLDDPDLAGSFKQGDAELFGSAGPSDDELFAGTKAEGGTQAVDPYKDKSHAELEAMWRMEGSKRGIHWMRALIEKHKIRGASDFTREMLVEALQHPEIYMPPAVA